jgi:ABC-type thiamin/hydroxymethylpyrimidine transport system permease subunit
MKDNIFVQLPVPAGILKEVIIVALLEIKENGVFTVKTEPVNITVVTLEPTLEVVVVMVVAALWEVGSPVADRGLLVTQWPAAFRISGAN